MKTAIATLMLASVVSAQSNDVLLSTDFNFGIPAEYELINNDNLNVNQADYKRLSPHSTWFSGNVYMAEGMAAISASRRTPADAATDNWLILPQLHITSENTWLQWNARSMHHDLLDGYVVMISTGDYTRFQPLFSVDGENYDWTQRVLSLADYVGKDVYIAFCHNATNKFALAVDDIFVGEPAEYSLHAINQSRHFVDNVAEAELQFDVVNTGKFIDAKKILVAIEGGETHSADYTQTLSTGAEASLSVSFPVEVGKAYRYTAMIETTDGSRIELGSDILTCSYYPRTLLLEKFTGVWCNQCTSAIPFINRVEKRLKDEVAIVEVHGFEKNADPMSCDKYGISLGVMNYPTVLLNRKSEHTMSGQWNSDKELEAAMSVPAEAMIQATAKWIDNGRIRVDAKSQFAHDLDNKLAKYRVGVLLKEPQLDNSVLGYTQLNNCTLLSDQEYGYLPGKLRNDLISFHHVARGGDTDESVKNMGISNGVRGTLPEQIEAGVDYECSLEIDMPETVLNPAELKAVVVLFNNSEVMNVAVVDKIASSSDIETVEHENSSLQLVAGADGSVKILLPSSEHFHIAVYRVDGSFVNAYDGEGSSCELATALQPGCYLVRAVQGKAVLSNKFIVQ